MGPGSFGKPPSLISSAMMVRFHPPVLGWLQRLTTVHLLLGDVVIPAIQQGFGPETRQKNHKSPIHFLGQQRGRRHAKVKSTCWQVLQVIAKVGSNPT
jgi:hypothetical protein